MKASMIEAQELAEQIIGARRRRALIEAIILALRERRDKPRTKIGTFRNWVRSYGKHTVEGRITDDEINDLLKTPLADVFAEKEE